MCVSVCVTCMQLCVCVMYAKVNCVCVCVCVYICEWEERRVCTNNCGTVNLVVSQEH